MDRFHTHLKKLDASLACGICCAVFDTPLLIRTCGHSFCAACIRQNIEFQERNGNAAYCPTCRVPCDTRDLVGNIVLRGVVEKYSNLLDWCQEQEEEQQNGNAVEKNDDVLCLVSNDKDGTQTEHEIIIPTDEEQSSPYSSGEEYMPWQTNNNSGSKRACLGSKGPTKGPQSCNPAPDREKKGESSFLECPVCQKSIHRLYMDGHIDSCLLKEAQPEKEKETWKPLEVPPKIIGTLANDKTIRTALRNYGIPCDGKKTELIDRYNRFRTEVEIANDKQEAITYERIVFRIAKKETYKAAASLFKSRMNGITMSLESTASFFDKKRKKTKILGTSGRQEIDVVDMTILTPTAKHPSDITLPDDPTYEDLIRITKQRDDLRRQLLTGNS